MTRFFTVAAFLLLLVLLLLLATNNAGNPAVLSTVEYAVNTDAAIADRAAERAHNERMAEIAAQELDMRMQWRTLTAFGVALIVIVGLMAVALVYGAASRPRVIVHRLEDRAGGVTVVQEDQKRIEVR